MSNDPTLEDMLGLGEEGDEIIPDLSKRLESVMLARDPLVLTTLLASKSFPTARILDCTANARKMWKGVEHAGEKVFLDIDPSVNPDVVGSFLDLPFPDASFDVLVFDPPHLPVAAASPQALSQYVKDYGLAHAPKDHNVSSYFLPFLAQAVRVLNPEGMLFAKVKDYVHNHHYQWSSVDFVNAVRATPGLTACDHIIKRDPAGGNLKSGRWEKSHHARCVHCSWIVVRKGKCESRRSP